MDSIDNLTQRLHSVHDRISKSTLQANRSPASVRLLAVSKGQPLVKLQAAYGAGQRAFGESYLQEALQKIASLQHADIEWHFIGRLQSNKIAAVSTHFQWLHSLSSVAHARKLHRSHPADQAPLNVCIQVNLSGETSKSGITERDLEHLADEIAALDGLRLRGLMTMPNPGASAERQRADYQRLRILQQQLNHQGFDLDTLSMGMSADYETAIAEGATIVRIGTAIFGPREYKTST